MAEPDADRAKPNRAVRHAGAAVLIIIAIVTSAILLLRDHGDPLVEPAPTLRPGAAAGFNLLLITLDTVRSDHLGCYGYALAETPTIDSLAARGVLFEDAVAPVPLTLPSHATMLTGLYPPNHGVRDNGTFCLAPEQVTFTETLKDKAYDTAAFIACFVLDERFGLSQGFDTYDFEVTPGGFHPMNADFNQRPATAVTDSAVRWLQMRQRAGRGAPFFVWAHYFDAHVPYRSPHRKLPRFAQRPYDGEIAFVDVQIKRLLEELDRQRLRARTLIVVVSDHGEGLGEHGEPTHGMFLYGSTLRVAFVLSCPSLVKQPCRIRDRVVSLVDLRPTLESLMGLPVSPGDGISLLTENHDPDRAVYIETKVPFYSARCSPLHGLCRHGDKYISGPEPEYYDLRTDPGERNNLHSVRQAQPKTLAARLDRLLEAWAVTDGAETDRRTMTPSEIARLGSLGYVRGPTDGTSEDLPEPKAMLRASRMVIEAVELHKRGLTRDALRLAEQAVDECSAFADGSRTLAGLYEQMNRREDAIRVLRKSLELNPRYATALELARILMRMGRYDEAERAFKSASALDPHNGAVNVLRGDQYILQGRLLDAIAQYEQAIHIDRHRAGIIARQQIVKVKKLIQQRQSAPSGG